MDALFKQFTPTQIFNLVQAFDGMARKYTDSNQPLPPKLKARGSQLFKLWFVVEDRLKAGASYIDQHPSDLSAATLYHDLVEARDAIHIALNSHWTEDFRLTVAKLLFDAEEIQLDDNQGGSSTGSDRSTDVPTGGNQEPGSEGRRLESEAESPG